MKLLILLSAAPLLALDYVVTLTPATSATGTVQTHAVRFDCGAPGTLGSLPAGTWPAPYVSGTKLTTWQVDRESWCANGSLEHAVVSYVYGGNSVQFRPDNNPCSSGNRAACDAAGLNQAGMLAFNGGTWTASAAFTANPQGSSTTSTFDARARLSAGDWEYILRGPAITQVHVGLVDESRTLAFGWKQHYVTTLAAQIPNGTATSATINDGAQWAGLSRPFEISVGASFDASGVESMLVCFVSGNTIYFGNANGTDASCANTNGRGVSGTVAAGHNPNKNGIVFLRDGNPIVSAAFSSGATSLTISDASAITVAELLQVGSESVRVCNKSGNTLTVGTAAWPCAADAAGRNRQGTSGAFGSQGWGVGVPVRRLSAVTDRWRDAPSSPLKTLQPDALLSFPAGWAGINAQFRVRSTWLDRLQSQIYDININSGAFTRTGVKQAGHQILHFPLYDPATPGLRGLWVGSTPPTVKFDFNLRWCVSIGICPVDPDLGTTLTDVSNFLDNGYTSSVGVAPAWTSGNSSKCEADTLTYLEGANRGYYGPQVRTTDAPGARVDIGLVGQAQALAQKAWGITGTAATTMAEMAGMMSGCTGIMPIHSLEHRTGGAFCNGGGYTANTADKACSSGNQSVDIFGLVPSVVYDPGINPVDQNNSSFQVVPVGALDSNGIVAGYGGAYSHMSNPAFWDSIISGNYFISELVISHAGAVATNANAYSISTAGSADQARSAQRGPFGLYYDGDGARQRAWPMRDTLMGALAERVGTPRREYFEWIYRSNIAVLEGAYNFTGGSYYIPCQAGASQSVLADINYSPWCLGQMSRRMNGTVGLLWPSEFTKSSGVTSYANGLRARNVHGSFMQHYENATYGWGSRFLSATAPFAKEFAARMITRRAMSSGANRWVLTGYQAPNTACTPEGTDVADCASQGTSFGMSQGFTSVANWYAALGTSNSSLTGPEDLASNSTQSRTMMVRALTRLNPRADVAGAATMNRMREAFAFADPAGLPGDPTWAFALWERPVVTTIVGDTTAKLVASTFWPSCKVAAQTTPFTSLDDSAHTTASMMGRRLEHVFTGLTAATTYYYMVTCGDLGRSLGTFTTTASAGGAVTMSISSKAPTNATNVLVEHGASAALGSSDTGTCSAGTCSASIAANTGRAKFFRITYRDAGNATLSTTTIYRRIP